LNQKKEKKRLQKLSVDIVAVVISKPVLIGVYENGVLFETLHIDGLTSDALPEVFASLLERYEINSIIYSRGPGSYMSIKLSYLFFKTLQIAKNIKLLACDGFYFNANQPIKAVGNSCFVKKEGIISLEKNKKEGKFFLPEKLDPDRFTEETQPLYVLKAV
jgi:tRNA A37 threonylcarbamoyladenosine modification protein TsaB